MADYVGRWKCDDCGTEVWGILRHCPNCGANTTGKYYLPEGEPPSTADEVMRIVRAGANWQCRSCQSDNYGDAPFCTECGGSRDGSPRRKTYKYEPGNIPRTAEDVGHDGGVVLSGSSPDFTSARVYEDVPGPRMTDRTFAYEPQVSSPQTRWQPQRPQVDFSSFVRPGLIALALFVVAGLLYLFLRPYEVNASIDRFEWLRNIQIEQFRTVPESGWSIPENGIKTSEEQRVHHYDSVFDHYETRTRQVASGEESYVCGRSIDNGNGTFSDRWCTRTIYREESYQDAVYRQEPRYETWYEFNINKWVLSRNVPTGGANRNDPLPHWGEFSLECNGQEILGCERESYREEHYYVIFSWQDRDQAKEYRLEEDRADWDAYDPEREYVLNLNRLGILLNDPLRPEAEN